MSGASLIFNSKQLEELESLHDSTGAFEEESDDSGTDDVGEGAMEWRRSLIEEAAENVKRATTRPVDPAITYEVGSLLFDRESRRFGRVNRSVPGYLRMAYLTGNDREYGLLDLQGYLGEFAATKKLSELATQLGMADADVERELDQLGLSALEDDGADEAVEAEDEEDQGAEGEPAAMLSRAPRDDEALKSVAKPAAARNAAKGVARAKPAPKEPAKQAAPAKKAAAAKKAAPAKSAPKTDAKSARPVKGERKTPPGKKANPIDDPNEFIRQNFQEMSNRELARHTGLSEHTIRRKLGEWGLKRKK